VPSVGARRPNHHHHPAHQKPDSLKALLAIVLARILDRQRPALEDQRRVREVETALCFRGVVLGGVEGDFTKIFVPP